ncbi:endonuclease [Sulfuriflexus sp.]|uniref:endonuclease III domain-containing protein n=1 Tax=Sulfuriflexus sp. TaxID=2015443 RepID=UPI0028CFA0CD|nr:endonuclease [Sulfuriflexus sp.]MDT8403727.1 endonuclease [Sulfuriflexus sp.]
MRIKSVYQKLRNAYGPQQWWPAESRFEVMVGAILTQNTSWVNVEKAITNLKSASALSVEVILASSHEQLANWLKPSGYFNIKARRLRNFCQWYVEEGGYDLLKRLKTDTLRQRLLTVNGVGPETADDIILYAFSRKVFVIDAYTRRIFSRLGVSGADSDYESLRCIFEKSLSKESVKMFNEYHALLVLHAKDVCRVKPRCDTCCLAKACKKSGLG